jgi:hypothetical protein
VNRLTGLLDEFFLQAVYVLVAPNGGYDDHSPEPPQFVGNVISDQLVDSHVERSYVSQLAS